MIFVREELCYKLVLEGINQARGASAGMAKDGKGWQRTIENQCSRGNWQSLLYLGRFADLHSSGSVPLWFQHLGWQAQSYWALPGSTLRARLEGVERASLLDLVEFELFQLSQTEVLRQQLFPQQRCC